jgi:SAM-dependent methyltransferase
MSDKWNNAEAYERYMGRWSPRLAELCLDWLAAPSGLDWLDVGCGTGALTRTILAKNDPRSVAGFDPSEYFVEYARERTADGRARFEMGGAMSLPVEDASFDMAMAGLVLNFVPDVAGAIGEMMRAVRPGGTVAAYVWDYADGMKMLRTFFDAAVALNPIASEIDEGRRFAICQPGALVAEFEAAGLQQVEGRTLEFTMEFRDFDDYWQPFLGAVGPAPAYLASLPAEKQGALAAEVRRRLPADADGRIRLAAKAWAARGTR